MLKRQYRRKPASKPIPKVVAMERKTFGPQRPSLTTADARSDIAEFKSILKVSDMSAAATRDIAQKIRSNNLSDRLRSIVGEVSVKNPKRVLRK